jgi:hypothetical protein
MTSTACPPCRCALDVVRTHQRVPLDGPGRLSVPRPSKTPPPPDRKGPCSGLQRQTWGRSVVRVRNRRRRSPSAMPFAMTKGAKVRRMPDYVPIEYPKWVDGVVFRNSEEERAHRATLAEVARAAELTRPPSPVSGCTARGNGGERASFRSSVTFQSPR